MLRLKHPIALSPLYALGSRLTSDCEKPKWSFVRGFLARLIARFQTSPKIPACHSSIRLPDCTNFVTLGGVGKFPQAELFLDCNSDSIIPNRQDIGSRNSKHQKHIGRP